MSKVVLLQPSLPRDFNKHYITNRHRRLQVPRCTAGALDRRNAWKRWSIHVPYALGSTFILPISASAARILIWNARKCSPPHPLPTTSIPPASSLVPSIRTAQARTTRSRQRTDGRHIPSLLTILDPPSSRASHSLLVRHVPLPSSSFTPGSRPPCLFHSARRCAFLSFLKLSLWLGFSLRRRMSTRSRGPRTSQRRRRPGHSARSSTPRSVVRARTTRLWTSSRARSPAVT